jgi:hypothetical protein
MKKDVGSTKKQEYVKEDFFFFKEKKVNLTFRFQTTDSLNFYHMCDFQTRVKSDKFEKLITLSNDNNKQISCV